MIVLPFSKPGSPSSCAEVHVEPDEPTVSVYVAEWLPEDAVPVTVIEYVPAAADDVVLTVIVEPAPEVTLVGLNETVTPDGAPLADSATLSALPPTTAVLTVAVALLPAVTEAELDDSESEKSSPVDELPPSASCSELASTRLPSMSSAGSLDCHERTSSTYSLPLPVKVVNESFSHLAMPVIRLPRPPLKFEVPFGPLTTAPTSTALFRFWSCPPMHFGYVVPTPATKAVPHALSPSSQSRCSFAKAAYCVSPLAFWYSASVEMKPKVCESTSKFV